MSDTELEWGAPPLVTRGQRRSKYDPIVMQLKANPGQQAKVMTNVNSASAKVLVQRGCKITTRAVEQGSNRVNVWAWWPDGGTPAAGAEVEIKVKTRPMKKTTAQKPSASPKPRPTKRPGK